MDTCLLMLIHSNYMRHTSIFETFAQKFKVPQSSLSNLLDYKAYGFTESDLDRDFYIDAPELSGLLRKRKNWKLRELIDSYKNAYCGKIGVEYMHIFKQRNL